MRKQLIIPGLTKLFSGIIAMGLLLFGPAWTFDFPGAWRIIAILFIPMLIVGVVLPYILARRIANEEQVLKTELKGYEEYCQKVKYRLIPFIW